MAQPPLPPGSPGHQRLKLCGSPCTQAATAVDWRQAQVGRRGPLMAARGRALSWMAIALSRPPTPDPLGFIQRCVAARRIWWTYHVNMRLGERALSRDVVLDAARTYEILESYPEDKYLPSFLVYACSGGTVFHVVFALDVDHDHVRVVTAYRPDPGEWDDHLRNRRKGR